MLIVESILTKEQRETIKAWPQHGPGVLVTTGEPWKYYALRRERPEPPQEDDEQEATKETTI